MQHADQLKTLQSTIEKQSCLVAEQKLAMTELESALAASQAETKKARQALRECEVEKAVVEEEFESNKKLVAQIRQKTLRQSQLLVDL